MKFRRRILTVSHMSVVLLLLSGCEWRRFMYEQPKYRYMEASDFFSDGQVARSPVPGTIPHGVSEDEAYTKGKIGGKPVDHFPLAVKREDVAYGRTRFNIYCSPCHDYTGSGNGMVVQRGFPKAQSLHIERLRNAPPGYFFDVMTNGYGQMPSYAAQVPVADRWAIVAYVKALQLSQHASMADVPEEQRGALEGGR